MAREVALQMAVREVEALLLAAAVAAAVITAALPVVPAVLGKIGMRVMVLAAAVAAAVVMPVV
jgi:VIT1/CCC1 family predicted Fe2+/Mn2+ transporter